LNEKKSYSSLPDPEKINARTYIIATQIYYELYRSKQEYLELKQSIAKYLEIIKQLFRVANLPDNIHKHKNFDYKEVLKEITETRKGQLRRQFEQIVNNPSMFGEKIVQQVEDLLKKHFDKNSQKSQKKKYP